MLHAMESRDDGPYRVPWHVDRVHGTHPLITNGGDMPLEHVRAFVALGHRVHETQHWGRVDRDETLELCLCDHDPAEAVITIAWYRPVDGAEYLWRFVL